MEKFLGEGKYGQVFKCAEHSDCAVKRFSSQLETLREAFFFSCLDDKFFPKLYEVREDEIHMELFSDQVSFGKRDENLSAEHILFSLASAIYYLHSRQICHGDIRHQNVLFQGSRVVLCDFSLSFTGPEARFCCGDDLYGSPESKIRTGVQSDDIYAFGIYALQILASPICLIPGNFQRQVAVLGLTSPNPKIEGFGTLPEEQKNLIRSCLRPKSSRPPISEVLKQLSICFPDYCQTPVELPNSLTKHEKKSQTLYSLLLQESKLANLNFSLSDIIPVYLFQKKMKESFDWPEDECSFVSLCIYFIVSDSVFAYKPLSRMYSVEKENPIGKMIQVFNSGFYRQFCHYSH